MFSGCPLWLTVPVRPAGATGRARLHPRRSSAGAASACSGGERAARWAQRRGAAFSCRQPGL